MLLYYDSIGYFPNYETPPVLSDFVSVEQRMVFCGQCCSFLRDARRVPSYRRLHILISVGYCSIRTSHRGSWRKAKKLFNKMKATL